MAICKRYFFCVCVWLKFNPDRSQRSFETALISIPDLINYTELPSHVEEEYDYRNGQSDDEDPGPRDLGYRGRRRGGSGGGRGREGRFPDDPEEG